MDIFFYFIWHRENDWTAAVAQDDFRQEWQHNDSFHVNPVCCAHDASNLCYCLAAFVFRNEKKKHKRMNVNECQLNYSWKLWLFCIYHLCEWMVELRYDLDFSLLFFKMQIPFVRFPLCLVWNALDWLYFFWWFGDYFTKLQPHILSLQPFRRFEFVQKFEFIKLNNMVSLAIRLQCRPNG